MPNADQPRPLPAASVEAILAAAGRTGPHAPALIEGLGRWLGGVLERAVQRANATPLSRGDVDRLETAHNRLLSVIEELQDRDDPPARMPVSESGATPWSNWVAANQVFGFKRGRRESRDWRLIAALIALYETVSERPASAAQRRGPTMRFLKTALRELADHAPDAVRSNFAPPNAEAVKQQMPRLRELYIPMATKELAKLRG